MVLNITYFVHGTTTDNENGISTGWNDGELSGLGKRQCEELKKLIKNKKFDVVFCSDLKRAVESAKIVFGERNIPIIQDKRLRECNYGKLNGSPSEKVEPMVIQCIEKPFPNGERCLDVEKRIKDLLKDLIGEYNEKKIAIVSHRAPQLALEVILNGKTWKKAIKDDWRMKEPNEWKPGWNYIVNESKLKN